MRTLLLWFFFCFCFFFSVGQDFSNKGKDFWVGYGYHQIMINPTNGNVQEMVLYFATDQVTTVTISVPGTGYTQTLTSGPLPAILTSAPIPKAGPQDVRLTTESLAPENKGIHVTSDKPIVAYAHIYNQSVSGASILFPTNTLGKDYFSVNFTNTSNANNSNCWMYVIAADTGTTVVEIIPSVPTLNHAAGVPFLVTLTQGQVFNVMATYAGNTGGDLTGSSIKSVSVGNVGCKRIAVFSGSGRISITCNGSPSSSDNYMVQAFPKSAWGKKYLTVSTSGAQINNFYRICLAEPNTLVRLNGFPISLPLINNFYYQIPATSEPQKIESDKPILVSQYTTSQGACGNGTAGNQLTPGDPEVIYLSPVEQSISKVLWNATPNFNILQHYYNVIIPNTGTAISSFKLDGVNVNPTLFTVHPQDPGYSYLQQNVAANSHRIESDSGFNAIAYGFGLAESYGYNAGTNVRDLYQRIAVQTQFGIESVPSVCSGSPFKFKISLPYQPDSMLWDFNNPPTSPPIANVMQNGPITPDSIRIINTRTVYWYSLPGFYTFNTIGTFPITIRTYRQNNEGCGNIQEIDFDLEVSSPPIAGFNSVNSVCNGQPVQFNDATVSVKPTYRWWWNFGDPASGSNNISNIKNPLHTFSGPGTYTVRYANITTPGCLSDTITKTITVRAIPTATLNSNAVVCLNGPSPVISFTGIGGIAPYIFTYKLNGGPTLSISSLGTSSVATISVSTTTAGTFSYILTGVTDGSSSMCSQAQSDTAVIVVGALPSASISGAAAICLNGPSPTITLTAANGAPPYTFTYHINAGPDITVTAPTGNTVTIPVATNTQGTFTYTLTNIQSGTSNACSQAQSGSAVVVVNGLPTATIAGTGEVCVGSATLPTITFTGASASAPYVFTYTINNGPNLTVTSSGNSAVLNVPTSPAGVYVYKLISVKEGSSSACTQAQTGSVTVTINPLPVADFNAPSTCQGGSLAFADASVANAGNLNEWTWNFGDPSSGSSNTSNLQNPSHIYNSAGTYTVSLTVKTDKGCISLVKTKSVVVNLTPSAGFINPEVCLADSYAQFTDTSMVASGSITGWIWNFDDPASGTLNTSTIQNPQHSYSTTGVKNVRLIAISNNGCRDTIIQSFIVNGDVPVANFNLNPSAVCGYDSVRIVNTATVNVGLIIRIDIYWDNLGSPTLLETDLNPFPNKVYAHAYPLVPSTRNYSIRYRVYSGLTCFNDIIKNVTVNEVPDISFAPVPNTCLDVSPFLIVQATAGGAIPGAPPYYSGPGINAAGLFNPSLVGPGVYTLQYTFATSAGCRDSATQQITVLQPPVADFRTVGPTCIGQALNFESLSTTPAGSISTWQWNFGDGTPAVTQSTSGSVAHTFNTSGTFAVALTVTTTDGCKKMIIRDVNIDARPATAFTFPASLCLPNAVVNFTNTSSSGTYLWTFGDPGSGASNTSTSLNPSHTYSSIGPFDVRLQVTSTGGCVKDTIIRLASIHPRPTATFTSNVVSACVAQAVSFADQSNPADGVATEWHWSFGDGTTSTLQNPSHAFANANSFNVGLYIVNSFGCKSDTMIKPLRVNAFPVVEAGPDVFVLQNGSITLTPTATGTNLTYLWSPATYLNNSTIANPVTTPLADIRYVLTVTAGGGCSISDSLFVKVLLGPKIPNTFTPNNDSRNDKWIIEYLETYPNNRVQVFTRTGQLVFESRGYKIPWDGNKNGKSLPIDTYYYIIEPGNGSKALTGYVTILK